MQKISSKIIILKLFYLKTFNNLFDLNKINYIFILINHN